MQPDRESLPGSPLISQPPALAPGVANVGGVSATLGPGSVVGPFTIEARIGQGGMATIYRARQDAPHRSVALKVIREDHAADPEYRRRFLDEAETLAALEHPAIVPIYAAGEAGGVLYIAMRLAEGSDLQQWIARRERLTIVETVRVLEPIADAIDHAHANGVVHHDLKPSNIVLDRAGRPYLTDFGVGRRLEASGGWPPGIAMGTLEYMAPEQLSGAGDPRSATAIDVYALGCVAYACLTGAPPFVRSSREQLAAAHAHEEPPSLRARLPEYPAQLDHVLARALAKGSAARFGSARAFVAALDAVRNVPLEPGAAPTAVTAPSATEAPATAAGATASPGAAAVAPSPPGIAVAPRPAPRPRRRGIGRVAIRSSALALAATVALAAGAALAPASEPSDGGGTSRATARPRTAAPATPPPRPAFPNADEARLVALQPGDVETARCVRVDEKDKDALAMVRCPAPEGQRKRLFFALYADTAAMADEYARIMGRHDLADGTASACDDHLPSSRPWRYADDGFFAADQGDLACYPRTEDGFDGIQFVWTHAELKVMGFWLAPDYGAGLDFVEAWLVAARP